MISLVVFNKQILFFFHFNNYTVTQQILAQVWMEHFYRQSFIFLLLLSDFKVHHFAELFYFLH